MLNLKVNSFISGLVDLIEKTAIKRGAFSNVLNWEALGDRMRLRRGMLRIGSDFGSGTTQGFVKGHKSDGTEVVYYKQGLKLMYYNPTTEDFAEVGSDIFTSAGEDDIMFGAEYVTNHGNQIWISSPNSSLFKIMSANPTSYTDMYDSTKNFKGYIDIYANRMILWGRVADKSGIYGSYVDELNSTTVTAEAIAGSGTTRTGTLAFKAAGAKRTCFAVTFTDGVETFTDNYDGTLTGSAGGTGTINYTSGAYSITFNAAAVTVISTYQWENSTDNGIADFTKSATRLAGEGFIFRQDVGGNAMNVKWYNDVMYCFHQENIWRINITVDDTDATNLIFRSNTGLASLLGCVSVGGGIWYVDKNSEGSPKIRLLTLDQGSTEVIPFPMSDNLDLSGYILDNSTMTQFDDKILVSMASESENNFIFAYDQVWKNWTRHDYYANCFIVYGGALWAGDTITENVYELFSGLDEDGSIIDNEVILKLDDLDIERLKKCKRLVVEGNIGDGQELQVLGATDNGAFVEIGTMDSENTAVDRGTSISVGNYTVGTKIVGSGSIITAFHFLKEFHINLDKFREIELKFKGLGVGWLEISNFTYKDIRKKSMRLPSQYTD